MAQLFWSLVPLYVIFFVVISVNAKSFHKHMEDENIKKPPCLEDHPLFQFITLFNDIPNAWKAKTDIILEESLVKESVICWTRKITLEHDNEGILVNKYSSYELSFGLPRNYEKSYIQQKYLDESFDEMTEYPPIEEISQSENITSKHLIYVKCKTQNKLEEPKPSTENPDSTEDTRRADDTDTTEKPTIATTTTTKTSTTDDDLSFITDVEDICDDNFDIEILNSLPDDTNTNTEKSLDLTRKQSKDQIDFSSTTPKTESSDLDYDGNFEFVSIPSTTIKSVETTSPEIQVRYDGITQPPNHELTTELNVILRQILDEMNNHSESPNETTINEMDFSFRNTAPLNVNNIESTSELPISTTDSTTSDETIPLLFPIQIKNLGAPSITNSAPECKMIKNNIKYGTCLKAVTPISILTENYLPEHVKLIFVEDLTKSIEPDDILIHGRKYCYLFKNETTVPCPDTISNMTTLLVIDEIPENPNDEPYFVIELKKSNTNEEAHCVAVNKTVVVIECPIYKDVLPMVETDNLPSNVRYKHLPGEFSVHPDDIIVHSFSHCLLFKTMKNVECNGKPKIIVELKDTEDITTKKTAFDEESSPTFRFGDYSLEKLADLSPKSYEMYDDIDDENVETTTPCITDRFDKLNTDPVSRTTRTLPETTDMPVRKSIINCDENDIVCFLKQIQEEASKLKTRKTLSPPTESNRKHIEITTPMHTSTVTPTASIHTTTVNPIASMHTTIIPTTPEIEIRIPKSRKLTNLIETIVNESEKTPTIQTRMQNNPEFIVKIICAQQLDKSSCYSVSKHILKPPIDDHNDYYNIIDMKLLPKDVEIVPTTSFEHLTENETIFVTSGGEKLILIKEHSVECPAISSEYLFILNSGSCSSERRTDLPEKNTKELSIVKYEKGDKVYCFDFDKDLRLHQIKCPADLTNIPLLSHPEDLKTLCRTKLKDKNQIDHMKLLRRMNIITDSN